MPDLHQWITAQVDRVEARARAHNQWSASWYHDDPAHEVRDRVNSGTVAFTPAAEDGCHIAAHDPEAVLRRCAADRRILARHTADPTSYDYPACEGCGTTGEYDWPVTDNINDCPELLDLAHAHGITEEELAALDRPQPPERQPARPQPVRPLARTADVPAALRGPNWQPHP